jgi:transcription antitermination factor NusG
LSSSDPAAAATASATVPARRTAGERRPQWHALWTRSNCEQLVHDQLQGMGFRAFLPKVFAWSKRTGARKRVSVPLFPGYLFLYEALDKSRYVDVRKARGLVTILGASWDRPAVVPDAEIDGIRSVVAAGVPVLTHPYLKQGRRVRIVRGPLAGVEGVLSEARPEKGLLVLSVELLQRSVAVEVDCTDTVPA